MICNRTMDAERALYHLQNETVQNCTFAGPADGESALKEAKNVTVDHCHFSLRYPLWHTDIFRLSHSILDESTRAPLWYASHGIITDCTVNGVKCLRECDDIQLESCRIHSPEFGWKCRDLSVHNTEIESEYLFFESRNLTISDLHMKGKYSFQYTENMTITDSVLDTKDAFWHSRHVTVQNSTVKGEYLGWYAEDLTFINCHIIGTQPLCYCRSLKLIDCTMEDTDLSFEYSDVQADIQGSILSVKNPRSGYITADRIGQVIWDHSIMETACTVTQRKS